MSDPFPDSQTDPTPAIPAHRDNSADVTAAIAAPDARQRRHDLVEAERARFGGMRFFLAFFGWLTATGMVVLLTAIATGVGAALGAAQSAQANPATTGIIGAIVIGVILLVAYYCGGYVAARMARFNGMKQGLAVWLWALIIVLLVAIAGLIAGNATGAFNNLGGIPNLPVTAQTATLAGIGSAVGALLLSLIGALLGGLAGMRFHRRVDQFTADHLPTSLTA